MVHHCPRCGAPLKIVGERWFCPNHGFLDEQEESEEEEPFGIIQDNVDEKRKL